MHRALIYVNLSLFDHHHFFSFFFFPCRALFWEALSFIFLFPICYLHRFMPGEHGFGVPLGLFCFTDLRLGLGYIRLLGSWFVL
jgi:hypothetical protein